MFLFTASVLLCRQSLKPVTDCPARISAPRQCLSASLEPHPCHSPSPVLFCSQRVRFSTAKVSILLTVSRAFLDPDGAFLHQRSLIPVIDRPMYVSVLSERASLPPKSQSRHWLSCAHFCSQVVCFYISEASSLSLTVPCAFLCTASALLSRQSLNLVVDCPTRISTHRWCAFTSTTATSRGCNYQDLSTMPCEALVHLYS